MNRIVVDKSAVGVNASSTQSIMLMVMAALVPGIAAYSYFVSPIVLINIAVAVIAALVFEWIALRLRGVDSMLGLQDASIALAAILLALAIPPMLPLWQLLVGVFIMVMLGKHVYGGLGHNPFNPAMVGYAALLISFPQSMTLWMDAAELKALGTITLLDAKLSLDVMTSNPNVLWDGITQATPLEHMRTLKAQSLPIDTTDVKFRVTSSEWMWINLGYLAGGLFLLHKKIIQWHIPAAVLISFAICSMLFSEQATPLPFSIMSGALILGAFFIATDPVTAASSKRGRIVFGIGIGSLTFVIREFGGYPEGIAFAVLLMNLCVPLIDHLDLQMTSRQ